MPEKITKVEEIKTNSDIYEIYLGTFNDDVFTWYSVKKIKDETEAYKEFKKYVNTQLQYTDEELKKVWDTGRLDIELRKGSKLLNWVGIYSRAVKKLDEEETKEAEEVKINTKKSKKDSKGPSNYEAALENAIDCLYYGVGRDKWNSCGLSVKEQDRCWKEAISICTQDEDDFDDDYSDEIKEYSEYMEEF